MKLKINKKMVILFCLVVFLVIALFGVTFMTPFVLGNETNKTVLTKVNVTNTEPFIYRVVISPDPVILTPGNVTQVNCTAYVHDWNGWEDFNNGTHNATFFDANYSTYSQADDGNYHYTNSSCQNCTPIAGDSDGTNATCMCSFEIQYFANYSTWRCNFTVTDAGGAYWYNDTRRRKNLSNWNYSNTKVDPLIAINVPSEIDYGELAVTENSSMQNATLTNYGNVNINISVDGWGGDNEDEGQNLSMICHRATDGANLANISIEHEKYSLNPDALFDDMINLTSDPFGIANFTLYQRLNDSNIVYGEDQNSTYWRIYIPLGVTGFCNGTIRFTARPTPGENVTVAY